MLESPRAALPLPAWVVNGATVTLGLALVQCSVGLVAGAEAAQIAIGAGVCTSLADVVAPTRRVARRVLAAGIASIVAGTLFFALRPYDALVVPGVALIVFASMLLLAWGPKAGTVSFAAVLSLVFAMSSPASLGLTWERLAWCVVGTAGYWIWALASAFLLQPIWRRDALAAVAAGEARLLAAIAEHIRSPAGTLDTSGILEVEAVVAERIQSAEDLILGNSEGRSNPLYTAVLLHLIDLRDLAMASNLLTGSLGSRAGEQVQARLKAGVIEGMSQALLALSGHLSNGNRPVIDERAEQAIADGSTRLDPALNSLLTSKLAILRALQQLLAPGAQVRLPCREADLRRYLSPDEWRLSSVTANLVPGSPVLRHALRTSITVGFAYALVRNLPLAPHPQWVVLTIVAVMQGSLAQTLMRRNARVLGTLAGCVVAYFLMMYPSPLFLSACFLVAAGVAHAYLGVRYQVTAAAAAVLAILQATQAAPESGAVALERFADTLAGGLLGWGATYLLPTWERKALPAVLHRAMAAMRAFAAQAMAVDTADPGSPRFARQQGYDAIRALTAIRARSLAEPAHVRIPAAQLTSWLTAAYGVMSGLSNVRLTLTLHARDIDKAAVDAAIAPVLRQLSALLDERPNGSQTPMPPDAQAWQVLASVPHLAARLRLLLENASLVSLRSAEMQSYLNGQPTVGSSLA